MTMDHSSPTHMICFFEFTHWSLCSDNIWFLTCRAIYLHMSDLWLSKRQDKTVVRRVEDGKAVFRCVRTTDPNAASCGAEEVKVGRMSFPAGIPRPGFCALDHRSSGVCVASMSVLPFHPPLRRSRPRFAYPTLLCFPCVAHDL